MLDQNTDRMWYVIGAVLIGAAIIFGMNTLMPNTFASVGESFTQVMDGNNFMKNRRNMLEGGYLSEPITNSTYRLARFDLKIIPVEGETYTITLKGSLGEDRTGFDPHNSGALASLGSSDNHYMNEIDDGIYSLTFDWTNQNWSGTVKIGTPTHVDIYQKHRGNQSSSTIEWITLVQGDEPLIFD